MKPIEFPEQNCVYAKDQPEYLTLPVHKSDTIEGECVSCWQLSEEEKEQVARTGIIWLSQWPFHQPLQPIMLMVDKPVLQNIPNPSTTILEIDKDHPSKN